MITLFRSFEASGNRRIGAAFYAVLPVWDLLSDPNLEQRIVVGVERYLAVMEGQSLFDKMASRVLDEPFGLDAPVGNVVEWEVIGKAE